MKPLLIVDGYNVLGAWSEVRRHGWSVDEARDRLMRALQDHIGYSGEEVVLVFDGYQSDRRTATEERYGDLLLVFTQHGETADSYIERMVAQTPRYRVVRVATSDGLQQSQILATGATRLTSRELLIEMQDSRQRGLQAHRAQSTAPVKRAISGRLSAETLARLQELRRGTDEPETKNKAGQRHGRNELPRRDGKTKRR